MLRLSAKSVPPAVEIAEDPRADPRPGRAPLANARAPGLWLTRRAADPDGHVLPGPDLRWPHPRPPSDPRHHSGGPDRKSTRLNSSHSQISYAVFCLKKKKKKKV